MNIQPETFYYDYEQAYDDSTVWEELQIQLDNEEDYDDRGWD